ncbi:General substrate transporter [Niveomyces insectorum RCEF 264]|uniref:General substrate transporter n=1 Tax=Niveomyces insectorum RCEF 264 TaxID=1081102 RepID=A0A167W6L5_9HYPO|nr:General substrate transporter [Niveomyces insectorum RCEF 264]
MAKNIDPKDNDKPRVGDGPVMSFSHLRNNTNASWWKDPCLRLNVFHCLGLYLCVFYLGYDTSLMNGLQALPRWQKYFNDPSSSRLGLIAASLFLPAIVTSFMSSAVNDRWGRKPALMIGSILMIAGGFVNAFANSEGMFIAGRALIGCGGPFGKITAVALLQELAHPRLRPILSTSYYCNFYVGSVVSAWICFGALKWDSDWSWRLPCLVQVVAPFLVLVHIFYIPESPRWLIHHGHQDKALAILAKYHANGDFDDELIRYEYEEICFAIRQEEENARAQYIDFIKTPGNRRRLLVLVAMATGTIWSGNNIITYYLAPALRIVGITSSTQILTAGINGGLAIWNLIMAYVGSLNSERFGRRKLWLTSTSGMLVSFTILTGLSGGFATTQKHSVGFATVPWLFIYYGFYDIGWTPLPFSYGAEILPYHMRLKGLGILLSVQSVAQAFNQWVNPVALASIAWKYHLTVEEVSVIFDTGRLGTASAARERFQRSHDDKTAVPLSGGQNDKAADASHIEIGTAPA